jgi:hypothetical protein
MHRLISMLLAGAILGLPLVAHADEVNLTFGGDQYTAGQNATVETAVAHDAFAAGYDVSLTAPVSGDAHLAGFYVSSGSEVSGDLYAAGFSVTVTGNVGGDLTAFGNSVTLRPSAPVPGNVRAGGQSVVIGSPVSGSALITAQNLTLDTAISGDLRFLGEALSFGPNAKVAGKVLIQGPKELSVPASVASADRVSFQQVASPNYMSEAGKTAETVVKGFWPAFWTMAMWWAVLLAIGAAFIALMPRGVTAMQIVAEKRPFRDLGLGVLAFASVVGLVPVFALTLVGIFLLPFVLVFVFVSSSLAYLAGVYFAGLRLAKAFMPVVSNTQKLGVLAVAIIAAALIGMIPVAGWLASLAFVAFGFGAIAMVLMVRWSRKDAMRLESQAPAAPVAAVPGAI